MMTAHRMNARDWTILALAMLVGAVLRSISIGQEALWADEALAYVLSQASPRALAEAPIDPTGPLYYWLHQLFVREGAGPVTGRMISLVAGVLTIPATYWLGRETVGSRGPGFAAWWVAVIGPLVDYSQEARVYATLVLIITLSAGMLLAALGGAGKGRRWMLAGFALTAVLALYAHFVGLFWTAPALAILLFLASRPRQKGARREAMVTCLAVVVAAIPEARRVWRYATENNAFHWLQQLDLAGFVKLVASEWLPLGAPWVSAFAALALLGLALRDREAHVAGARHDPSGGLVVGALLLQPLALWLFGFFLLPVLMFRTMLPSLPAAGILIATLLAPLALPWRMLAGSFFVGAALLATTSDGLVRPKEQWNATRRVLAQAEAAGTLIVACPFWKAPALMSATRGLKSAPLMTPMNGRMLLIENRFGENPEWDRVVFGRVYAALLAPALGVAPPSETHGAMQASALFVLTSECGQVEEDAIAEWAGPHAVVQRWTSAAQLDHAGIVIERWQLAQPRTLPVSVAR